MDEQQLEEQGVSIHAGFPNAAVGSHAKTLNLTKLLVKHPAATYLMQLDNNAWARYGLFEGDLVVVDRAIMPKPRDLSIWTDGDEFVISVRKDIPEQSPIWGVVSSVIHQFRK